MDEEQASGPHVQPDPDGGWSEAIVDVTNAIVLPPVVSSKVQAAGVLHSNGDYCAQGALWRRHKLMTTQPDAPSNIPQSLGGNWLWGGVLWNHFGHFLVESSSRLWGLDQHRDDLDGILFVPKRPMAGDTLQSYHRDFIDLLAPDFPIHVATEPTTVEQLRVPGQGFGLGKIATGTERFRQFFHSEFAKDVEANGPCKIYISRSELTLQKGGLLGEEHLEELLRDRGYEIFHPQNHDLKTQIARYKAATHIIGADGSALHLFAMVGRPDQSVAVILRRTSGAHEHIKTNLTGFCGRAPSMISALRTEWLAKATQKSDRRSFGELDHAALGRKLADAGFLDANPGWESLTDDQRHQVLDQKGLNPSKYTATNRLIIRQRRIERRAKRAAEHDEA